MNNKFLRAVILIVAVALFVAMAVGSGTSDTPASQGSNTDNSSTTNQGSNANTPSSTNQGQNTNPAKDEKAEYTIGETSVKVWTSSIGSNWVTVVIPVKNTGNVNLYLSSSSVDVENADGSLAATLKMVSVYPQIIKPGETAYYFEETTYEGANTEGLNVVPHVKAEKATVDIIRLEVSDLQIKDDMLGASVMGRVNNTTDEEQSMIYVVANFFDKDGKLVGQQFTILSDKLPAGEKIGFETSSLSSHLTSADIATYDVIAFPYQFQFQW